ncbi:ATP-binding protein [Roseateles sp. UC29_93]|uniref:ATP-binding protein n=1 Tax=Roseateles sp. UC29_93 TaxID=3350177 RepID=UPI0036723025
MALVDAVDETLAQLGDRLAQQALTVRWLRRDAVELQADAEMLALAISNLLTNAIDFAPAGSELALQVGIEPATDAQAPRAFFELRDHGPGVPAGAFAQLGERFFSTARPGSLRKGSGLGLAIVRQIAGLHRGELRFEPAGPGLRVRLAFPLFTAGSQTSS